MHPEERVAQYRIILLKEFPVLYRHPQLIGTDGVIEHVVVALPPYYALPESLSLRVNVIKKRLAHEVRIIHRDIQKGKSRWYSSSENLEMLGPPDLPAEWKSAFQSNPARLVSTWRLRFSATATAASLSSSSVRLFISSESTTHHEPGMYKVCATSTLGFVALLVSKFNTPTW